jgi:hypothetical protein
MLDGVMFVHGGISADYACLPVFEINRRVRSALATRDTAPASIINDPAGPLWYRGLVQRDNDPTSAPSANPPCKRSGAGAISMAEERQQVLRAYGAGRMVVAHTPILSGISVLEDGRLVRVDTGISAAFGGKLTYLEIADGALAPHVVERPPAAAAGAR